MAGGVSTRDLYILGMLSRGRTYGHELAKAVKVSRAEMWVSLSDKHVYYVLRKLARDGLVTETEERQASTPPRKVYEITDAGRQALRRMLSAADLREAFVPSPFDAVVGMLAYTDVLEPDDALEVLRARRDTLHRRLRDEHPAELGPLVEQRYGYLARSLFEKARALLQAELTWIDGVIERAAADDWEKLRVRQTS